VLSARDRAGAVGRVAESGKVVPGHDHFKLTERQVGGFQLRYQHGIIGMLASLRPSVVVSMCHSGTITEWLILQWARKRGTRCVAWQCGYEYSPGRGLKRLALACFVPRFDFHLCYHTNARRYAVQYGARPENTLVMHNTIDERSIVPSDPAQAKALLAEKYPVLLGKKIVLYVGAVLEEKRIERVFEALSTLGRPDTVFVVVGDGPHLAALRARYADRGDCVFTGSVVKGVGPYFDAADVFVLPGTGGLAINEAMAHRVPVIAGYADGSADDLVVDGITGYRLREDTVDELADRLQDMLRDLSRARAMGLAGEQRIRGHLSFVSFIDRVVGVLEHQHALATGGRA
jgi:glycosyltransferase involved in cell wall biosynthesis